jgi:FkbM family methyltransferase
LEEENFEGVIYKPLADYYSFIKENYIHTCIVSRFSEYLPVTFNGYIENVYLVVHDLTPSGIIIPLNNKLKKIFCLTEWHVEYFTNIFPSLKNITVPFYYGIDFEKFSLNKKENNIENNKEIQLHIKEKYKFIYSSFPNRGLLQLLQMWPTIYESQPKASLHIYSDVNGKWVNQAESVMMKQIQLLMTSYNAGQNNMNIYYHGWVNKQTLAEAWLSADMWFYPCTFKETFCLTALEAALTKTLVITNDLAALQNTVGQRGVIIKGDPKEVLWQAAALLEIKKYLDPQNIHLKNDLIKTNYEWASTMSWETQANKLLQDHILKNRSDNINSVLETICSFKLDNKNDFHILKIGAFKGNVPNDTVYHNINSNAKVIFVEPVPSFYHELKENYNNKFNNNKFIYLNDAISDKNEKLQIYYPSKTNNFTQLPWWIEQIASSNIKHCHDHGYILDLDVININAITVKQIIELYNIQMLFCLMIDTEGSDFKILMNIDFSMFKPLYISFENMHLTSYHNRGENYSILITYLSQFGYKIIDENESDTLMTII